MRITQTPIIGHEDFVFEDMREETDQLMKDISACMGSRKNAMAVLLQKFNDPDTANHILYYLRLLASSWFKGDPAANELTPFIPDGLGIAGYCQEYLELPGREIEHLGLIILVNALLKPVGFVLEIAYLDRSPGAAVNTYRIPAETNGQDPSTLGPIIYLLFRPDHYDILYRDDQILPVAPVNLQVHRATSFSHRHDIVSNTPSLETFSAADLSPLALIPGFSGIGTSLSTLAISPPAVPLDSYSPGSQSPWMPQPFSGSSAAVAAAAAAAMPMPEHYTTPAPVMSQPNRSQTPPLRFSEYCHPSLVESDTWHEPTFTTSTFKNSHYNTAHYNNPNFQPEEYKPDADDYVEPAPTRGGRKRSAA
jgi:ubiquitin thioesterase protein OTUB1